MNFAPKSVSFALLALLTAATMVEAHSGHSHADIPSVIRHPFAGPEHFLVSGATGIAVAALLIALTRRVPMPALARWMGAWVVAAGVTLGLSV